MNEAREHEALAQWLAHHDEPCPVCSYNLRSLASPTCPECSAPLRLGVTSPNMAMGPWLLAIISFALGLGFDGVVAVLLTIAMTVSTVQGSPPPLMIVGIVFGGFVTLAALCALGLWRLIARRRQWRMAPLPTQWARAWAIFGAVFVVHALGGALMALMA